MAQYLVKRFSDIFGKLKITPSRDLLWFDASQKAKEIENELRKKKSLLKTTTKNGINKNIQL